MAKGRITVPVRQRDLLMQACEGRLTLTKHPGRLPVGDAAPALGGHARAPDVDEHGRRPLAPRFPRQCAVDVEIDSAPRACWCAPELRRRRRAHEAVEALVTGLGHLRRRHLRPRRPQRVRCWRGWATGRLIAFDKRPRGGGRGATGEACIEDPRFAIVHASFADMAPALAARGITQVDGVLLDLGVSSPQIDNPERGFSFRFDAPLDMRMDTTRGETAAEFLARADERDIAEVIRDYGEERFAGPIAKALVARRDGGRPRSNHPRTGRARGSCRQDPRAGPGPCNAHVSSSSDSSSTASLKRLSRAEGGAGAAGPGQGRLAVISFHSLEDRIVKRFIQKRKQGRADRRAPMAPPKAHALRARGRLQPRRGRGARQPARRSAVLRVAERTEVPA
jgi:16S rRNA (cytosine1402-N4)-methyltransferase